MKKLVFLLLLLAALPAAAQHIENDLNLLQQAERFEYKDPRKRPFRLLFNQSRKNVLLKYNPLNLTFSGLMFTYQNVFSSQLYSGCMYSPSCSDYGKAAIAEFGLVKGIFLTADRLYRCNRIAALDVHYHREADGRVIDHPASYREKKEHE